MNNFKIEIDNKEKFTVVHLSGEFAGSVTCNDIMIKLKDIIEQGRYNIIMEMMHVDYADSLAVGIILCCLKEVEKLGGKLVMSNINPHIKKILYVSKLHTRLEIFDNLDDALSYAF